MLSLISRSLTSVLFVLTGMAHADSVDIDIDGNSNNIFIEQAVSSGSYVLTAIIGDSNDINMIQTGTGNKTAIVDINGNNSNVNINQKDGGSHYTYIDIDGQHDANILQEGSGSHSVNVSLYGTGSWNFNLNQSSSYTNYSWIGSGNCGGYGTCNYYVNQQ